MQLCIQFGVLIDCQPEGDSVLQIPDGVNCIAENALADCPELETIVFPEGLETLEDFAFRGCTALREVQLPSTLHTIGSRCFFTANQLETIRVSPENPVYLDEDGVLFTRESRTLLFYPPARKGAYYAIPEGTQLLSEHLPFYGNACLKTLRIPVSLRTLPQKNLYTFRQLEAFEVPPEHPTLCAVDGVLFNQAKTTLIQYPPARKASAYSVPETVARVCSMAFLRAAQLEELTFPAGTTVLEQFACQDMSRLVKVQLPERLACLARGLFWNCTALSSIRIPPHVMRVGEDVFYQCDALRTVYLPDTIRFLQKTAFRQLTNMRLSVYRGEIVVPLDPKQKHPAWLEAEGAERQACFAKLKDGSPKLRAALFLALADGAVYAKAYLEKRLDALLHLLLEERLLSLAEPVLQLGLIHGGNIDHCIDIAITAHAVEWQMLLTRWKYETSGYGADALKLEEDT